MEEFEVINSRGLKLRGVLQWPASESPVPALLVLHGCCGHKGEAHIKRFTEAAQENGLLGVRFDASGFGDSDGTVGDDFRVSHYLEDIKDVVNFLENHPRVQGNCISICGHSLGASLAIIFAAQHGSIVSCSAIQPCSKITRTTSPLDLVCWKKIGSLPFSSELPHLLSFSLPWSFAEDADRFDATLWAHLVNCKLQIMYGTLDDVVIPEDVLSILKNAPKGTALVVLEGMAHDFKMVSSQVEIVTAKLFEFIVEGIGAQNKSRKPIASAPAS